MDMEKLKQWLDMTKQYQATHFWKDIFQDGEKNNSQRDKFNIDPNSFMQQREILPHCDLYEYEGMLIVEAELPGINPQEIYIALQNTQLIIRGEFQSLFPSIQYYLKERPNRKFEKKIELPIPVSKNKVTTSFDNGILKVFLPLEKGDTEFVEISLDKRESL
jgi:HSP20 family protein